VAASIVPSKGLKKELLPQHLEVEKLVKRGKLLLANRLFKKFGV
jgi:hypothetical protein